MQPIDEIIAHPDFQSLSIEDRLGVIDDQFQQASQIEGLGEPDHEKLFKARNDIKQRLMIEDLDQSLALKIPEEKRTVENVSFLKQSLLSYYDKSAGLSRDSAPVHPLPRLGLMDEASRQAAIAEARNGSLKTVLLPTDDLEIRQAAWEELKNDPNVDQKVAEALMGSDMDNRGFGPTTDRNQSTEKEFADIFSKIAKIGESAKSSVFTQWQTVSDDQGSLFSVRRRPDTSSTQTWQISIPRTKDGKPLTIDISPESNIDPSSPDGHRQLMALVNEEVRKSIDFVSEDSGSEMTSFADRLERQVGMSPGLWSHARMIGSSIGRSADNIANAIQKTGLNLIEGVSDQVEVAATLAGVANVPFANDFSRWMQDGNDNLDAYTRAFDQYNASVRKSYDLKYANEADGAPLSVGEMIAKKTGQTASFASDLGMMYYSPAAGALSLYNSARQDAYDSMYETGLRKGLTPEQAHDAAADYSVVSGAVVGGITLGTGQLMVGNKLAMEGVRNWMYGTMAEAVKSNTLKGWASRSLGNFIAAAPGDVAMNVSTGLASRIASGAIHDLATDTESSELSRLRSLIGGWDEFKNSEFAAGLGDDAFFGVVGGMIGGGIAGKKFTPEENRIFENLAWKPIQSTDGTHLIHVGPGKVMKFNDLGKAQEFQGLMNEWWQSKKNNQQAFSEDGKSLPPDQWKWKAGVPDEVKADHLRLEADLQKQIELSNRGTIDLTGTGDTVSVHRTKQEAMAAAFELAAKTSVDPAKPKESVKRELLKFFLNDQTGAEDLASFEAQLRSAQKPDNVSALKAERDALVQGTKEWKQANAKYFQALANGEIGGPRYTDDKIAKMLERIRTTQSRKLAQDAEARAHQLTEDLFAGEDVEIAPLRSMRDLSNFIADRLYVNEVTGDDSAGPPTTHYEVRLRNKTTKQTKVENAVAKVEEAMSKPDSRPLIDIINDIAPGNNRSGDTGYIPLSYDQIIANARSRAKGKARSVQETSAAEASPAAPIAKPPVAIEPTQDALNTPQKAPEIGLYSPVDAKPLIGQRPPKAKGKARTIQERRSAERTQEDYLGEVIAENDINSAKKAESQSTEKTSQGPQESALNEVLSLLSSLKRKSEDSLLEAIKAVPEEEVVSASKKALGRQSSAKSKGKRPKFLDAKSSDIVSPKGSTRAQSNVLDESKPEWNVKAASEDSNVYSKATKDALELQKGKSVPVWLSEQNKLRPFTNEDVVVIAKELGLTDDAGNQLTDPRKVALALMKHEEAQAAKVTQTKSPFDADRAAQRKEMEQAAWDAEYGITPDIFEEIKSNTHSVNDEGIAQSEMGGEPVFVKEDVTPEQASQISLLRNVKPRKGNKGFANLDHPVFLPFKVSAGLIVLPFAGVAKIAQLAWRAGKRFVDFASEFSSRYGEGWGDVPARVWKAVTSAFTQKASDLADNLPDEKVTFQSTEKYGALRGYMKQQGFVSPQQAIHNQRLMKSIVGYERANGRLTPDDLQKLADMTPKEINSFLRPIWKELGDIHPDLGKTLLHHVFTRAKLTTQWLERANPFLRSLESLNAEERRAFNIATRKNSAGDPVMLDEFFQSHHDVYDGWKSWQLLATDILGEAKRSGVDIGFQPDYFPSSVKNLTALRDLMHGPEFASDFLREVTAARKKNPYLSSDDESKIANSIIAKSSFKGGRANFGSTKGRKYSDMEEKASFFYHDPHTALVKYINGMAKQATLKSFFGADSKTMEGGFADPSRKIAKGSTFGGVMAKLIREGKINPEQEKVVVRAINDFIDAAPSGSFTRWVQSTNAVLAMHNPITAIRQATELVHSIQQNGLFNSVLGMNDSVNGRAMTVEDIGAAANHVLESPDNFWREFSDITYKMSGRRMFDNLAGNTFINSYFRKLRQMSRPDRIKALSEWKDQLTEGTVDDLADAIERGETKGNYDAELVAFGELSRIRPTSMASMPAVYLKNPRLRLLYNLRTFTAHQLDYLRESIYGELHNGNYKKGLSNLVTIAGGLVMAGAGADSIIDWILGRPTSMTGRVTDNAFKLFAASNYMADKMATGDGKSVLANFLSTPAWDAFWNVIKTGKDIEKAQVVGDKSILEVIANSPLAQQIPTMGLMSLWRSRFSSKAKDRVFDDIKNNYSSDIKESAEKLGILRAAGKARREAGGSEAEYQRLLKSEAARLKGEKLMKLMLQNEKYGLRSALEVFNKIEQSYWDSSKDYEAMFDSALFNIQNEGN